MRAAYAVVNAEGRMLSQSADFQPEAAAERVSLSDGTTLLIQENPQSEIAALRRQLDEAVNENAAKESFLSSMSHDLRTPMNAIVGLTALAKKHLDEKPRVLDALNKMETASAHLLNLINDVLDMSRINSGRLQLNEERFSLSDLMHDVLTIIRPQMEQRGHHWRFTAEGIEAEALCGDALRLRQIYVNIINNAVKYTPEGGEITIGIAEELRGSLCDLLFTCQDNGVGMSEAFLERIFNPFERVNSAENARIEGTGLGMSIVKRLVEAMQGAITIDSAPGQGTLVTIRVPLRYERLALQRSALKDQRILIVEADAFNQRLLAGYLEEVGAACTLVTSATEAVNALTQAAMREESFCAVLIGEQVDDASTAFDIAQYLHRSHPELPLIWVSGADWSKVEYQAQRSGIHTFIPQPVFRKSLINGISQALAEGAENGGAFSATPDLTGKRLLLVDDNLINREIAREILSVTHAEVDTAENGQEALERYLSAASPYALILMDIQMPVMDGYEAARQIRAADRADAKTIPIIAMTANTFAEDIRRAKDAGMNGHLAKPVSVEALMHELRSAIR